MNANKLSQNLICFIGNKIEKLEAQKITATLKYFLDDKRKPLADNTCMVYYNTITDIVDVDKDKLRAIVICPNNVNIKTEINRIKQKYFNIKIVNTSFYLKKDIYFVIDVIPCSITNLIHCHFKDCTDLYTIEKGQDYITNSQEKIPRYIIRNIYSYTD